MARLWLWMAVAAMVGCAGGGDDDETGIDSGDTGEDTSPPPCQRFEITGEVVVPAGARVPTGEVLVDLVWVDLSNQQFGDGPIRDQVSIGAVAAGSSHPFSLCIADTPVADDLYAADETNPSFQAATYALRAYEDDGFGGASTWVGSSAPSFLVYADGTPPQNWTDLGLGAGWNVLTLDLVADLPSGTAFASGDALDVPASLLEVPKPPLTGSIVPNLSTATNLHVGAYNVSSFIDTTLPPPVQSTVGAEAVTVSTGNANFAMTQSLPTPSADHLHALTDLPYVEVGWYAVLAFDDTNQSATFELGEPSLASSAEGDSARLLSYFKATDWRASLYTATGVEMGWNLAEGEAIVAWSTGVVLQQAAN